MVKKIPLTHASISKMFSVQECFQLPATSQKYSSCEVPCEVRSCGKVILTGEHAVMYGAKAVATALLEKMMHVVITHSEEGGGGGGVDKIFLNKKNLTSEFAPTIYTVLQLLDIRPARPLSVNIESHIPLGAGLGASAALSVNMVKAFSKMFSVALSAEQIIQYANTLEERFHGSPSGLDVATVYLSDSLFDSAKLMSFQKTSSGFFYDAITAPGCFPLLLVDSGLRTRTKTMVGRSERHFSDSKHQHLLAAFDRCHDQFLKACGSKDHSLLASVLNRSAELLWDIDVVGDVLAKMMQELKDLGVMAAKPTGSGGAGYVLVLLPELLQARAKVMQRVRRRFPQNSVIELWI